MLVAGCTGLLNQEASTPRLNKAQEVVIEIGFLPGSEYPPQTGVFLVTQETVCGTRLASMNKRTEGPLVIYSTRLYTFSGERRYLVVQPPKASAEVFVMTLVDTPSGLDWIPWARPDFLETSDDATWNVANDLHHEKRSREVPREGALLRYHMDTCPFP